MHHNILTFSALSAAAASLVAAQGTSSSSSTTRASSATSSSASSTFTPLVRKRFDYDDLPYKADPAGGIRGPQVGYNRCNATTEGQESLCQTATINSIDDFCLWAPPEYGQEVGYIEGEMVAWCTKPGRGQRLIPQGALKGVQFLRAPSYIQVVGMIDQQMINMLPEDYGGEMDPHGADNRGNPIGGLLYSQQFGNATSNSTTVSTNTTGQAWTQVVQWHNFMGANVFCLKACDPDDDNDWRYCEHIYDRIGCHYNAPARYEEDLFQSCESDNMLYPGYYVGSNGETSIYTQPPESLGVISTVPYEPVVPSSSMCTNYTSAALYTGLPVWANATGSAASSAATSAASSAVSAAASGSSTTAAPRAPGAFAAAAPSKTATGAAQNNVVLSTVGMGAVVVLGALAALS